MRFLILSLWLAAFVCHHAKSYPLKARNIKTITNQVTTCFNDSELKLSVFTKKKAGVRATIFSPSQDNNVLILFDEKDLYLSKNGGINRTPYARLSGQEAAENLFQMLALNPWIHFPEGRLKYNSPALEDYRIVFDYVLLEENIKPTEMRLYQMGPVENKLLSTIQFVEFFSSRTNLFQPKTLLVTDHTKQIQGEVQVENFTYNLGVADFLFDAQAATRSALAQP